MKSTLSLLKFKTIFFGERIIFFKSVNKIINHSKIKIFKSLSPGGVCGGLCGGLLLFFFSSCVKVIDINLNTAAKKYVIQGIITNKLGDCKVQISQTVNFNDANNFPPVSGAVVTIKDNNNSPVTLSETVAGNYQTAAIKGTPGHTYFLSVTIAGQVFTAKSQMPPQVNLDSVYVNDLNIFGSTSKRANVVFNDPAGKGEAYRFIQYKNRVENKTIFVINDDYSDGRINYLQLIDFENNTSKNEIHSGDTVKVDMQCIDAAVYKYWFSLATGSTGSSQNASPGNPVTNIIGGALGYFSAHTTQSKSVIVK